MFLKPTKDGGIYRFDAPLFKSIKKLEWDQLFSLPDNKKKKKAAAASASSSSVSQVTDQISNLEAIEC